MCAHSPDAHSEHDVLIGKQDSKQGILLLALREAQDQPWQGQNAGYLQANLLGITA